MFFAGFDTGGGGDPDDGDEGDEAERQVRMLEGERDRHEIDKEGEIVLMFDGFVLRFKFARVAQAATDGKTQKKKAEAGEDHGCDIDGDGEGVNLLLEHVGGEERQQREAEEKAEVGVEDELVRLFGALDEVVVVDPIDPSKPKEMR